MRTICVLVVFAALAAGASGASAIPPRTILSGPSNQPKEMTVDLGDGVKMELVLILAGTFMMGSDKVSKPVHHVTITKAFYFGKFEVTQEQWEKVMGSNPSKFKGAKNPVESVTWDNCQKFLEALQGKVPSQTFRLPTEAEWEYACRARSRTEYYHGDAPDRLRDYAWFKDNS
jgi:formylglycine-generating enzyme required for sulfatase activity